jgi:dimethylargininase
MTVFEFNQAIVRQPALSVVDGIRSDPASTPRFAAIADEHRAYVAALQRAGLGVDVLAPLEAYPDSIFVEDPALVFPEGAILLRPGAPQRTGERDAMRLALARHFERLLELGDGEYVDGGDVLVTPDAVLIGLSGRTNRAGAEALCRALATLGRDGRIVETPRSVLHFKTAVSLLAEDSVVATRAMAECGIFAGFQIVLTADGEDAAANLLRVNETVLVGEAFPRTAERIARLGFRVEPLCVREVGKLDAGLSCMSLRWKADATRLTVNADKR